MGMATGLVLVDDGGLGRLVAVAGGKDVVGGVGVPTPTLGRWSRPKRRC